MFPRNKRLSREQFPTPKTTVGRATSAYFAMSVPENGSGYAVVVSKKVAKSAVDRHLLKRRIIAALMELKLPTAVVVYPRAAARSLRGKAMQVELNSLLEKFTKTRK